MIINFSLIELLSYTTTTAKLQPTAQDFHLPRIFKIYLQGSVSLPRHREMGIENFQD